MSFRLTPQTLVELKGLLEQRSAAIGVRLSVTKPGCSGLAYKIACVDHIPGDCQCLTIEGLSVFVDEMAMVYLAGSELDLVNHAPCHLFAGATLTSGQRCTQPMTLRA